MAVSTLRISRSNRLLLDILYPEMKKNPLNALQILLGEFHFDEINDCFRIIFERTPVKNLPAAILYATCLPPGHAVFSLYYLQALMNENPLIASFILPHLPFDSSDKKEISRAFQYAIAAEAARNPEMAKKSL